MPKDESTCRPTPFDWGSVSFKPSREDASRLGLCGPGRRSNTFLHQCMAVIDLAAQLAVDAVSNKNAGLREMIDSTAAEHVLEMFARIEPQDPLEEMLIGQAITTHYRLMRLTKIMLQQSDLEEIRRLNDAIDRTANTYRRQMMGLREYRRPTKAVHFVGQNNVANQQVVSNSFSEAKNATNEQGCEQQCDAGQAALPTDAGRVDPLAGLGEARETVDAEHRSEDRGRQGQVKDERPQTRRKKRGQNGRTP